VQRGGRVDVGGVEQDGEHGATAPRRRRDEAPAGPVRQPGLHPDRAGVELEEPVAAVDDVVDAVAAEEPDLLGPDDRHDVGLGEDGPGDDGTVAGRDPGALAVAELVVEAGGVRQVRGVPTRSARATAASLATRAASTRAGPRGSSAGRP